MRTAYRSRRMGSETGDVSLRRAGFLPPLSGVALGGRTATRGADVPVSERHRAAADRPSPARGRRRSYRISGVAATWPIARIGTRDGAPCAGERWLPTKGCSPVRAATGGCDTRRARPRQRPEPERRGPGCGRPRAGCGIHRLPIGGLPRQPRSPLGSAGGSPPLLLRCSPSALSAGRPTQEPNGTRRESS
jgi:hypothetical protein